MNDVGCWASFCYNKDIKRIFYEKKENFQTALQMDRNFEKKYFLVFFTVYCFLFNISLSFDIQQL
jgi:hypothetical protein